MLKLWKIITTPIALIGSLIIWIIIIILYILGWKFTYK